MQLTIYVMLQLELTYLSEHCSSIYLHCSLRLDCFWNSRTPNQTVYSGAAVWFDVLFYCTGDTSATTHEMTPVVTPQ